MSACSYALNVKITSAGGYQADGRWLSAATAMGHTASIVPVSTLDNNTFFATTDILIVSTGMFAFTPAQVATIQSFLQSGKSVYLQGEYTSSLPGNQAFSQIVNALGGSFTWGTALTGNLAPGIIGSMSDTSLSVPAIPYFFYGCTGSASCNVMAFVVAGNTPVGWMFRPSAANMGRLIFTTDQDWVGASNVYASCLNLMKNVLYHLADKNTGDQVPFSQASVTAVAGTTACEGNPLTFSATSVNTGLAPSYQWKKNGVNTGTNSPGYTSTTLQNGDMLTCVVGGCVPATSNSITVTIHALDTLIQPVNICPGQLPYTWNGITVAAAGSAAAVFTIPSLLNGCDSTTILQLSLNPSYNLSSDTVICFASAPYIWGGQSLNSSGSYVQNLSTAAGCDSTVTLNLHITPAPVSQPLLLSSCRFVSFEGNSYVHSTVIKDTLVNGNGCDSVYRTIDVRVLQPVYDTVYAGICQGESYTFGNEYYERDGTFVHQGTAANGCDSFSVLMLTVYALPEIKAMQRQDGKLCIGDTLRLSASGGLTYEWFDGDNALGAGDVMLMQLNGYSHTIRLSGKDEHDCVNTDELLIAAEACCTLQMPNAFSPNGDGLNDGFGPVTNGHPEAFRMLIFNRWGHKVFTSQQVDRAWDGTISGSQADAGVYFYEITGKCVSGSPLYKRGEFVLVR
jgi:gliding motility-associated-like protein